MIRTTTHLFAFCLVMSLMALVVQSKYYLDNGYQNVLHSFSRESQREEMEDQILDVLGLEHRPKPKAGTGGMRHNAAPKFLMDLYQKVLDQESGTVRTDHLIHGSGDEEEIRVEGEVLSRKSLAAIDEADKIISFANQNQGT